MGFLPGEDAALAEEVLGHLNNAKKPAVQI